MAEPERSSGWAKWLAIAVLALAAPLLFAMQGKHADAVPVGAQPEVVMYANYWCNYCAAARTFFAKHGIAYTELDVEKDAQAAQLNRQLGGGVPTILIGDQIVHGFDQRYLTELLKPWMRKPAPKEPLNKS